MKIYDFISLRLFLNALFLLFSFNSINADTINTIQKIGSQCPTGFYTSGGFCKPYKNNRRKAILNINKSRCPSGFFLSAKFYCVSYQKFK